MNWFAQFLHLFLRDYVSLQLSSSLAHSEQFLGVEGVVMKVINALEYPNFDYFNINENWSIDTDDGRAFFHAGQYSRVWQTESEVAIVRDPLGCNKLFYGYDTKGDLVVANRIECALKLGVHLDNLASCPPGQLIRISDGQAVCALKNEIFSLKKDCSLNIDDSFDLDSFQMEVAATLKTAMKWLKSEFPYHSFIVCLSGGIDSSAVASLSVKYLDNVTAVSFSYISEKDAKAWLAGASPQTLASVSNDFLSAYEVAKALNIPFYPVLRTYDAVYSVLPTAIRLCQDWRDFNVHCAVVNLFLAQEIRAIFTQGKILVLTGDLMNEYVCDYHEEVIDKTVYYPQPRMSLENRRRFFIRGLSAGDREIGVFNAFGLPVCQIYSVVAEQYLQVPCNFLTKLDSKEILNGHLLAPGINEKVCKVKCRAQVGGKDGGTLGICHRIGLDQNWLKKLWIQSLPEHLRGEDPLSIIQFGSYRSTPRKTLTKKVA